MKRIVFVSIIAASLFIIYNLAHSIYTLWHKQGLLAKAQKELEGQRQENQQLKQQLTDVQNPDFIEKEARNKLFLVKPGESSVVIDENLLKAALDKSKIKQKEQSKPYFQQWWELFF